MKRTYLLLQTTSYPLKGHTSLKSTKQANILSFLNFPFHLFLNQNLFWKRWHTGCISPSLKGEQVLEDYLYFPDKTRIAHEILAYLKDHPDAQDTLEGIVEWWLLETKIKYQTTLVMDALADLVEKELILEHKSKDSRVYYQANRTKMEEILEILKQMIL
jgi:hypothetical protein